MSAEASLPLPESSATTTAATRSRMRGAVALATAGALLLAAGCAEIPRDANGSPATARLAPNAVPPAPLTVQDKQKLDALNQQVLREQDAAIARQQQAEAYARATYAYPNTSWNLFYGGWGGGHWGGGVSVGMPGYGGWGGYPYWW